MDKNRRIPKQYNDKEYLMMREEILQYLREYQAVRNMMYLVTATTIGFAIKDSATNLFLLPLIVILPSYVIATDYWKCVTKAATYLIVFYEREEDSSFHWESRHAVLHKNYKFMTQINYQHIPYYVCGAACFALYFFNVKWNMSNVLLGIGLFLISAIVYICYGKVDQSKFITEWEKIKDKEKSLYD